MLSNRVLCVLLILLILVALPEFELLAMSGGGDVNGMDADRTLRRVGIHRGNQVRTVFGNWGAIAQPSNQGPMAAWRHDGDGYVGDISPLVGAEVIVPRTDENGMQLFNENGNAIVDTVQHVVVTPVDRPGNPYKPGEQEEGRAWTFEPIRGFLNPFLDAPGKGVAMSHQPDTWPEAWPDCIDCVDSLGNVIWNGYFGPGITNADQESYFWISDHNDRELLRKYNFKPDSLNLNRHGLGLNIAVRGLQWSNILAEDNIFWLYDIHNTSTTTYRRTAFGVLVGMWVGGGPGVGGEWEDNVSFFDVEEDITYAWKFNFREPTQNPRWVGPVGIVGVAFLESPGNPFDGIDNDGNVERDDTPRFREDDFGPPPERLFTRTIDFDPDRYNPNSSGCAFVGPPRFPDNHVVIIEENTRYYRMSDEPILVFDRELICLDELAYEEGKTIDDTLSVVSQGITYNLWNGKEIVERNNTGIDENLNGLIDENYNLHYEQIRRNQQGQILFRITRPLAYKNYFTGEGLDDPLIDERRDDGISNFLGIDTDPRESDQIGLTSFEYFTPADLIDLTDKQDLWERMKPGFFDVPDMFRYDPNTGENIPLRGEDGNYSYASGYFPLPAGGSRRMSVALVFGQDFDQLFHNKTTVQDIYDASYQFPQPPEKPTLTAVPGDGEVTLIWDDIAESSYNQVLALFYPDEPERAYDFQGYKLYRSKDPDFREIRTITDGRGNPRFYKPLIQYDKINDITGFFNNSPGLNDRLGGAQFWLGSDTGLQHRYVDTDVKNGVTYYYALVAYNYGSEEFDVFPSENTRFIHRDVTGEVVTDINTAVVVPNAPSAGYIPPEGAGELTHIQGHATGDVHSLIINPRDVRDNRTYRVEFADTAITRITTGYHVLDVTDRASADTLVYDERIFTGETRFFDGLRLVFNNHWESRYADTLSGWMDGNIWEGMTYRMAIFDATVRGQRVRGVRNPADYEIEFFDEVVDTSIVHPVLGGTAQPLNFQVRNVTDGTKPKVRFSDITDQISRSVTLVLIEEIEGEDRITWRIPLTGSPSMELPGGGYRLSLRTLKPFSSRDAYEFTTVAEYHDADTAKAKLENIRVVPNPYVAAASWEQPLPPGVISGRGERKIDFINVPEGSKIDIYTSRGAHVVTLHHEGGVTDGSVSWNLRTKENLDVAFGVYFYVVDAPDVGQKFGRIAIIK